MSEAPPTRAQVLLGWFVVWQIGFMLVASLLSVIPRAPDDGAVHPIEIARQGIRIYYAATLQTQNWRLFPEFPPHSVFVAARLLDEHGETLELASDFEPADPYSHIDWAFYRDRLWNFQGNLALVYLPWDESKLAEEPAEFQAYRIERAERYGAPLRAYLRWKVNNYARRHPGKVPAAAVLEARVFDSPAPHAEPWAYRGPLSRPLVRWQPGSATLAVYNPHTRQFDPVVTPP